MRKLLPALLLSLAACGTCPEIPDMPAAPEVVRVPVTEYVVPEWLIKPLPEDAPKANTPEEATRLACARLSTVQVANCRFKLAMRLVRGEQVDPLACEKLATTRCEVRK